MSIKVKKKLHLSYIVWNRFIAGVAKLYWTYRKTKKMPTTSGVHLNF